MFTFENIFNFIMYLEIAYTLLCQERNQLLLEIYSYLNG